MSDYAQIQLRILIKRNSASVDSCLAYEVHSEIENLIGHSHLHIELQSVLNLQTQMITIIVDREKLLSVELKDGSKNCLLNSIGTATYSSNSAIVCSHLAVFETWWVRSQYVLSH
jgi:hypothetical protein